MRAIIRPGRNKKMKVLCLLLISTLNLSCIDNSSTGERTSRPGSGVMSRTDTLKFTSGIRPSSRTAKVIIGSAVLKRALRFTMAALSATSPGMMGYLTIRSIPSRRTKTALSGSTHKAGSAVMTAQKL